MEIGATGFNPALSSNIATSREQLTTGKQVNDASDNPSAVQILNQFSGQIRSESAAVRNVVDGVSAIQVAEGGLSQVNDSLQQLRELGIQAGNGTLNDSDRATIQSQADELLAGIRDTIGNTQFNNQSLLDNDNTVNLQTGANSDSQQSFQGANLSQQFSDAKLFDITFDADSVADSLTAIDNSLDIVDKATSDFGSIQSRLDSTASSLNVSIENQSASRSQIEDTDYAAAVSKLTQQELSEKVEIAILSQANASRGQVLQLLDQ